MLAAKLTVQPSTLAQLLPQFLGRSCQFFGELVIWIRIRSVGTMVFLGETANECKVRRHQRRHHRGHEGRNDATDGEAPTGGGGRTQMRTGEARPVVWPEKFFYKQKRWQKSGIHRLLFLPGFVWLLSFWLSLLLVSAQHHLADLTDGYSRSRSGLYGRV